MYASNTIYVVGDAKAPQNNPITEKFKSYFVAFVLVKETGEIVDADCSATIALTSQFVKYLFLHKNINDPALVMEIKDRYFGSSQKALLVALKDAQKNIIKSLLCLHIHRQNPAVRIFLWLDFFISHVPSTWKVSTSGDLLIQKS